MLRYQSALASVLGSVLVVAALGDGEIRTLEDALAATARAIDVLHGIEKRLEQEPAGHGACDPSGRQLTQGSPWLMHALLRTSPPSAR